MNNKSLELQEKDVVVFAEDITFLIDVVLGSNKVIVACVDKHGRKVDTLILNKKWLKKDS